jgi:hypothetical protein
MYFALEEVEVIILILYPVVHAGLSFLSTSGISTIEVIRAPMFVEAETR